VRTSEIVAYRPGLTFDVTAGIGAFDSSLVPRILAAWEGTLPAGTISSDLEMLADTEFTIRTDPVSCDAADSSCSSYLLPGGLNSITPWPPSVDKEYPVIEIFEAPALQVDIVGNVTESFSSSDCSVFGTTAVSLSVEVCVAQSVVSHGSIIAR
jgi:hypothetical protein